MIQQKRVQCVRDAHSDFLNDPHTSVRLSVFHGSSDYGVNLTGIHSRPFQQGDTWNYRFFAELSANMDTKEIRALLYQLSQETEELKILGSYRCEGDF